MKGILGAKVPVQRIVDYAPFRRNYYTVVHIRYAAHTAPLISQPHANLILTADINVKACVNGDRVFLVHCSLQLATKLYNNTKRFRKTNPRGIGQSAKIYSAFMILAIKS